MSEEESVVWLVTTVDSEGRQTTTETLLPGEWLAKARLRENNIVHFEGQRLEKG